MVKVDVWNCVSTEQVADCRVFRVRQDHCDRNGSGETSDFFVIESPDWVNVIPLTNDGDVVMIEQFRQGTREVTLELPGGMIDPGETPEAAARRELREETGYSSDDWILIGASRPNPALQSNTMYHFLARNCKKTSEISLDENESILTKTVAEAEVRRLIADGVVTHSLVVAAFLYLQLLEQASATGPLRPLSACP
ncbi:MAG: NUDIX hydrolase [Acidobacteria bacterium]|nr:NUDIX hydrolase [Acidobacteriota bacterium]